MRWTFGPSLAHPPHHLFHRRSRVVLTGDETRPGELERPGGQADLLDLALELSLQEAQEITELLGLLLTFLLRLGLLLLRAQLDLALADTLPGQTLVLGSRRGPELVDGVGQQEHLQLSVDEGLEVRRAQHGLPGAAG